MTAIIGNQNPQVGETNFYEISIFSSLPFLNPGSKYEWYLFKKQKNGNWIDITKNGIPKTGNKVDYTFFEPVAGDLFEIRVFEVKQTLLLNTESIKTLYDKLEVRPTASKTGQIDKVVLFNRGKKDVNKADYRDTLIAQASCTGLFGQEIEFQVWEDDASGEGHNAEINKNNKIPKVYKAIVNEKGIAEAKISLSTDEKIMRQIANKYLMKGDKDEGANHEYYVTATHLGKGEKASQVNVNVANPDYKPKPKENTAKFPATPASKTTKQPDAKGKITDAYFVDESGKKVSKIVLNDSVKVRISSQNMKGKKVQYVIWEYDSTGHDEILRKTIVISHDIEDSPLIKIDTNTFGKGYSTDASVFGTPLDSDSVKQNYFIEVIPLDVSAESKKFGVDSDGLMEVEKLKSPAVVDKKNSKDNSKDSNVCKCEARVRAYMRMLRVGEGTGELVKSSKYNKETKKNEVVYVNSDFESGYTKLFGGGNFTTSPHNKDMKTHPQIKIFWYKKKNGENVYSSATGAYQVMGYTWNDKNMINKRKNYNIIDFSPESQDKFCIILFKYKRAGMLDLIIKGEIKAATEQYGSYEWASLPPGRYGQPMETMEKALELYNKFYKEELLDKSPLHLKKGFLKEFDYNCCEEKAPQSVVNTSCGKSEIDLRNKIKWQTQFDPKWGSRDRQMVACKKTCDDILINSGLKATSLLNLYQTALENKDHTKLIINTQVSKEAVSYLDKELEKGHPVQVGVDHGLGYKINNNADHSTDHFVVIIGRKCDGDRCFYLFYDVGTSHKEKGASDNNRLYFDKTDNSLKGKTVYNGHFYTVTQVRKN